MSDANEPKAYLVSRPLKDPEVLGVRVPAGKVASHNYVVSGARHPGDWDVDRVKVHSYGCNDKTGKLDRVDHNTKGFSEGTHAADVEHWKGLSKDNTKDVSRIDAKPETVDAYANGFVADKKYPTGTYGWPIQRGTANSNSAAQAIANRSASKEVPTPDGRRMSPGKDRWKTINFSNSPKQEQAAPGVTQTPSSRLTAGRGETRPSSTKPTTPAPASGTHGPTTTTQTTTKGPARSATPTAKPTAPARKGPKM
jgi:hypothetical protein